MNYELLSSILLAIIILFPLGKKCEIRLKNILILSLIVGILTGFSTILIVQFSYQVSLFSILAIELCFLFVFTGIIGLYRFYRDPERLSPDTEGIILSPADGFIRYIEQLSDDSWNIGITMTYLDVHIIRSPVNGAISSIEKKGAQFLSLKKESAIKLNTQVHIVIDNGNFKIKLILIASRLVRKILIWVKEKQEVKQGTRLGKIVFGSQTDILIPALVGLQIKVQEKQQVYAGLTILARYDTKLLSNL